MEYKVSVIIPVYNRAYIVARALDSVLRQTLQDIEVIVVDDGSTDNSVEVVKGYQNNCSNIKLFTIPHSGPGAARDVGIKNAHGTYVVFLDSDDFIPERAYELMFQKAEEEQCDFVIGQIVRKIDTVQNGEWFIPEKISRVIRSYLGANCVEGYDIALINPSLCNRMIRRSTILENNLLFGAEMFAEDYIYNINLFRCSKYAAVIDEVVYCYETNYLEMSSSITAATLELILSGLKSLSKSVLFFDSIGRVDWEINSLLGPFEFVLQRFKKLPFHDKEIAFEKIKEYLKHYQNRREYEIPIRHLMGMDLDVLLLLPYSAYEICQSL